MSTLAMLGASGGVVCAMAAHMHAMLSVRGRFIPGTVCRLPVADTPTVALTFDDGPHPEATPAVLDLLGEAGVTGTFFMIGSRVAEYPRIAERVTKAGHTIGNHSYSHLHTGILRGGRFWDREISCTCDEIHDACGVRTRLFRPPIGHRNFRQQWAVRRAGHRSIGWSCRGLDGVVSDPSRITERILSRVRSRDIILLHDGVDPHRSRDWRATVDSLKLLLPMLTDRGYRIGALPPV